MDPERVEGECAARQWQVDEFRKQLAEYEAIRDGRFNPEDLRRSKMRFHRNMFAFAHDLLVARLASGVSVEEMTAHLDLSVEELRHLEDNEYRPADRRQAFGERESPCGLSTTQ